MRSAAGGLRPARLFVVLTWLQGVSARRGREEDVRACRGRWEEARADERVGGGWKAIERWLVWWLKDGCGWVEVSDSWRGVEKRLYSG